MSLEWMASMKIYSFYQTDIFLQYTTLLYQGPDTFLLKNLKLLEKLIPDCKDTLQHENLPGVRIASGSLGQGMSVAIGAALSKKLNEDDKIIYSLHGDGELQEGQNWEAIMFASANKVDNLICTIDYNKKQIDGSLYDVLDLGNLEKKFKAFDWEIISNVNGNNYEEIESALNKAKNLVGNGKPIVIIMDTEMGNGVDFMMGTHKWHGVAPNDEQLDEALKQNPETIKDY